MHSQRSQAWIPALYNKEYDKVGYLTLRVTFMTFDTIKCQEIQ